MSRVIVRAIEALQVIQNADNDLPLVAGRKTWVRVYLDSHGLSGWKRAAGRISVGFDDEEITTAASSNRLDLNRAATLAEQRLDWSVSLNFELPQPLLREAAGRRLRLRLASLELSDEQGGSELVTDIDYAHELKDIEVVGGVGMSCRILRFRHPDHENIDDVQPSRGEAEAVRRFVTGAFPLADIDWSEVTLAAPRDFRALAPVDREDAQTQAQLTRAYMDFFQYMLALRERDIADGRSAATLYLGMIDDPAGRFGGAAMDSPQHAAPHVVAMTTPDSDGSLGAHELAHALGRRHPGIPDSKNHGTVIGQRNEEGADRTIRATSGINKRGFLSNHESSRKQHVAVDCRYNRYRPELLAHDRFFDLMTYRYPQWVSDLTYVGLLERFEEIEANDYALPAADGENSGYLTVIGEYDLERGAGRIYYLARGRYATPLPPAPDEHAGIVQLGWDAGVDADGKTVVATEDVYLRHFDKLDGSPHVGVFQHTLGLPESGRDAFRKIGASIVSGDTARERFLHSFEAVRAGNTSLKLLLREAIVDEMNPIDEAPLQAIKNALENALENRGGSDLELEYSIDDGAYYLRYNWRWPGVDDASRLRLLTSIACRRKTKHGHAGWETVAIGHAHSDLIWVSPEFFSRSKRHPIYGGNFPNGAAIRRQSLEVRIGISVGFDTIYAEGELGFARETARALRVRRDQHSGYLDYPGGAGEKERLDSCKDEGGELLQEPRTWYRDIPEE